MENTVTSQQDTLFEVQENLGALFTNSDEATPGDDAFRQQSSNLYLRNAILEQKTLSPIIDLLDEQLTVDAMAIYLKTHPEFLAAASESPLIVPKLIKDIRSRRELEENQQKSTG